MHDRPEHEVFLNMFKIALSFIQSNNQILIELSHYIVDNLITKICIFTARENHMKYKIKKELGKQKTYDFPKLYKDILMKLYPSVPDYDKEIEQLHRLRNFFQHGSESIELSIRKEFAEDYIKKVEKILNEIGVKTSDIKPISIINGSRDTPEELFNHEFNSRDIQSFFNRISAFINRLIKKEFSTSDKILVDIISDFSKSNIKQIFGINISQTRRGSDKKIEFLNGKYILIINMHDGNLVVNFYKEGALIILSNPFELMAFYKDLQEHIELNTGYELILPENLLNKVKQLNEIKECFEEFTDLIIQLYKTESKSSSYFAKTISDSKTIQKLFGISIKNPNRQNGYLADEFFYLLEGKYYIIPNSMTLRIKDQNGNYKDLLTKWSTQKEIFNELKKLFEDFYEYILKHHDSRYLEINLASMEEKLLSHFNTNDMERNELEKVDYDLLENHINKLKSRAPLRNDPFLYKIREELGKISRNKRIDKNHMPTIEKIIKYAKEAITRKENTDIKDYLEIIYFLTFTKESLDLIKSICYEDLKRIYEDGLKTLEILKILFKCGYFGSLNSAIIKSIDEKNVEFLNYLINLFYYLIYDEKKRVIFINDRINMINSLYDQKEKLDPKSYDIDKKIDEIINELIYKYENLKETD